MIKQTVTDTQNTKTLTAFLSHSHLNPRVKTFDQVSRDHLIGEQLNFLVNHTVNAIFDDDKYMDKWKSELLRILRTEIQEATMDGGPPTQQELLDVLVKPETLKALQSFLKMGFDKIVDYIQEIPVISLQIEELREDKEDNRHRPQASA